MARDTHQGSPSVKSRVSFGPRSESLALVEVRAKEGSSSFTLKTMCTTMMVLCTIALVLRQKFSNKIKPEKDQAKETEGCSDDNKDGQK
ncbi:unnamed protein product [Gadus morhua 'NCC']